MSCFILITIIVSIMVSAFSAIDQVAFLKRCGYDEVRLVSGGGCVHMPEGDTIKAALVDDDKLSVMTGCALCERVEL